MISYDFALFKLGKLASGCRLGFRFSLTASALSITYLASAYFLGPSLCSSAAAASVLSAASPAPAPDGGSPSSSDVPAAPAGASKPGAPVAAARRKTTIKLANIHQTGN